jgi:hypothetical protein
MTEKTVRIMKRITNTNTSIRKIRLKRSRTNKKCDEGRQAEAGQIGTREYEIKSKEEE